MSILCVTMKQPLTNSCKIRRRLPLPKNFQNVLSAYENKSFSRTYCQLCLILGQVVIGCNESEHPKPVVGQLTKVLLHTKPEIQTETIEIFHEPKRRKASIQQKRESTLKARYIVNIETQCYGPNRKSIIQCIEYD